jgi:hypothetical protein
MSRNLLPLSSGMICKQQDSPQRWSIPPVTARHIARDCYESMSQLPSRKCFLYSSRMAAQLNLITQFISTSITRFTGFYVYVLLVIKHKILYHFMGHCKNKRHINGRHVTYHIQYTLLLSFVIQSELHLCGIKLIVRFWMDGFCFLPFQYAICPPLQTTCNCNSGMIIIQKHVTKNEM